MKINCSLLIVISVLLTGCAHPIVIKPDENKISTSLPSDINRDYKVGYYISSKDKNLEVTTLGGGGDNVRYYPYRDIEDGYRVMLSNVFESVIKLNSIDKNDVRFRSNIDFIIVPKIITTSGSTGFFTWPPTNFTVDLTNTIKKVNGEVVSEPRVIGSGGASTSEKLMEHGIAGRRAIEDALLKTQDILSVVNLPNNIINDTALPKITEKYINNNLSENSNRISENSNNNPEKSISERLKTLKILKENRLISEQEFSKKRTEILNTL
ncbi:SHOCT domain-containing protein [Psychromonas sp. SP041]|uniref:SHOCT domain-containing protein n=1 Tax=Psychromonas sp. SP041 TaxID=1365007 RepID=UPI00040D0A7E|nr:SHOCT domain-containing protein [Psychromonas sp. SP041]